MGMEKYKNELNINDDEVLINEGANKEVPKINNKEEQKEREKEIEQLEDELKTELSDLAEELDKIPGSDELGGMYPEGIPDEIINEASSIKEEISAMAKGERGSVSSALLVLLGGAAVSAALFYLGYKAGGFDGAGYVTEFQKTVGALGMISGAAIAVTTWINAIVELMDE